MSPESAAFWAVFGLTAFAFALAVQIRLLAGHALRRALMAKNKDLDQAAAGAAVAWAAGAGSLPDAARPCLRRAVADLRRSYPKPLAHIRIARRACLFSPGLAAALLIGRRLLGAG